MPRVRPSPEHNAIQNPAISRAIQRFTGLRQAHVVPGLSEGLQSTVTVGDIREDPRNVIAESFAHLLEQVPDGTNVKRAVFCNPVGHDKVCVLRRMHVYAAEDYPGPVYPGSLIYSAAPQEGYVFQPGGATLAGGYRLVSGYEWTPTGVGNRILPQELLDFAWNTQAGGILPRSRCGWHSPMVNGIDGQYYWRGTFHGEETENFNSATGPRFFVFPGGTWHAYMLDANFHGYWNMWWDEYPIR